MNFYKIRNKRTGLFRCAGGEPKWNKGGKTFDTLGKLRSMITNCMRHNKYARTIIKNDFSEWEIIEYEAVARSVKDVHEIVKAERIVELLKV